MTPTPIRRDRADTMIDPLSLVIDLPQAVQIVRADDSAFQLRWRGDAPLKSIQLRLPDGSEQPLAFEMHEGAAVVALPSEVAHGVFLLEFADGVTERIGQRSIPLEGGINFRDLGGYRAADGRSTRWGRVFRSGALNALTPTDLAYLERIGVKLVCDLRMPDEAAAAPDRLPAGAQGLAQPINTDASHLQRIITLLRYRHRLDQLMLRGYIHTMIDRNAATFGAVFKRLADAENLPAILHCTAGKDRAGMTAALLLLALGVPEETVLADYSLSNRAYDSFREQVESQAQRLRRLGIGINSLHPMLLADPATMRAALDHVKTQYGGVAEYLKQRAGLDEAALERLKANLLE